jgi:L-asparaginase II
MDILVNVTRGNVSESRHYGFLAVADSEGQAVFSSGPLENDAISFLRSSAKPLQALPLVESGAADRFGLTEAEIALACASHSGEDAHVAGVLSMLKKGGLSTEQLACGAHAPYHTPTAERILQQHQPYTVLHSNCSGKHTGMLLTCLHLGFPIEGYYESSHPLQQLLLHTVAEVATIPLEEVATGVDGCSVVCFGMTTLQMATTFARLAKPAWFERHGQPARAEAVRRITQAMMSNPFLVSGTGRHDLTLMEAAPGRVVSKIGAEAVWCMGFPEQGLGLAIKVEDGANRAHAAILVQALRQTGLLSQAEIDKFATQQVHPLHNVRGLVVGEYQPAFQLKAWKKN